MKYFASCCIVFLMLNAVSGQAVKEYDLHIANINLIDGRGTPVQENVQIYIDNGKIAEITKSPLMGISVLKTIEGKGKFVMPGLLDAHVHASDICVDPEARKNHNHRFKTMIHYGVTTALILGGSNGSYAKMREVQEASANGSMIGPRIYFSSLMVTKEGAHPMKMYKEGHYVDGETIYILEDSSQVHKIVSEAKANNTAGIKLMVEDGPMPPFIERIDEELVQQLVAEAHKHNVPVYAHISDMEEVEICIGADVDHLAHFAGVNIDWNKHSEIIYTMAQKEMSWITTLSLLKSLIYYRLNPQWIHRPEVKNVYDSTQLANLHKPGMQAMAKAMLKSFTGSDTVSLKDCVQPMVRDLDSASKAGVNIVLGTDVGGDGFIFAGLSMHEEMEIMQMGGMEPLRIIQLATYNGAKMLGIEKEYGSLEAGKYADFILLTENPAEDITHSLSIEKVFKGGVEQARIVAETNKQ